MCPVLASHIIIESLSIVPRAAFSPKNVAESPGGLDQ